MAEEDDTLYVLREHGKLINLICEDCGENYGSVFPVGDVPEECSECGGEIKRERTCEDHKWVIYTGINGNNGATFKVKEIMCANCGEVRKLEEIKK